MSESPTFACPFCGAPISGGVPGATFACPYCRAKVVAPHSAPFAPKTDTGSLGVRTRHAPPALPSGPFSSGVAGVVVAFDPSVGFMAIGPHAPVGEPPRLRAWDLVQGRVAWESLSGQSWVGELGKSSLKVIGRSVYVGHKRQLLVLDLLTGSRKWGSPLSDAVSGRNVPEGGLELVDPFPQGARGAILVRSIDNGLYAFDRDSGQPLWNRSYGDKAFTLEAVAEEGAVIVRYGEPFVKVDVVNPAYAQPIASLGHDDWSTDLGACRVTGRTVLSCVESYGPESDAEGLLGFDAVTGRTHFFDEIDDLEQDVLPVAMGPRVFAASSDGAAIYVGPRGRSIPCPIPNHVVTAFFPAGPTLVLLLKKAVGTGVRRIIGIDPASLAFRFDAGEAGTEPDDAWERQLATDGWSVVYVATPDDDSERSELRSLDTTTGRTLWSRPVGRWRGHAFLGGHVVVWSAATIDVLAPSNGQVVATLRAG